MKKIILYLVLCTLLYSCGSQEREQFKNMKNMWDQLVAGLWSVQIDEKKSNTINDKIMELQEKVEKWAYADFKKNAISLYSKEISDLVWDIKWQKSIKENTTCMEQIEKIETSISLSIQWIDGFETQAANDMEQIGLHWWYLTAVAGISTIMANIHLTPFCTISIPK